MRITVTLDDEVHERLVEWAKADRRSVASTAARMIEFVLVPDTVLQTPEGLTEEGRRLASQRDDLIAQGVPASELAVPLAPDPHREDLEKRGPERATRGGGTSSKPVTELAQPPHGPAPGAVRCEHPKNRRQVFGWGTLCDACGQRL